MAKMSFSHAELIKILLSNELLPKQMLRPKVEGDEIHFVVETNLPLIQFVPASLRFLSYADNKAIFELTVVNSSLNAMIGRLNLLSKLDAPEYVEFDFPKVYVDINELLKEKNISGVLIKDIIFKDDELKIVTCST